VRPNLALKDIDVAFVLMNIPGRRRRPPPRTA
jgi:hypothetical protein